MALVDGLTWNVRVRQSVEIDIGRDTGDRNLLCACCVDGSSELRHGLYRMCWLGFDRFMRIYTWLVPENTVEGINPRFIAVNFEPSERFRTLYGRWPVRMVSWRGRDVA